jgi:hypothetical protein
VTDKPEEPDFTEMVNNILGDDVKREEFFAQLEDPMKEVWASFHMIYLGLLSGGFKPHEAQAVMGAYLYALFAAAGGDTN